MLGGRKLIIVGLAVLAFVVSGAVFAVLAFAAETGSHDVTITIATINSIELYGDDITIAVDPVTEEGTDSSCSLSYSTNLGSPQKITVELTGNYPSGINLYVKVDSESGSGQDEQLLTASSSIDVIKDLTNCSDSNQTIYYRATADSGVPSGSKTKTVTYTITAQ